VLNITYFGHSAFMLEADGKTTLVDPFIGGNPHSERDPSKIDADTVLLTHAHNDHVGDTIAIAKRTGAKVIATFELAQWLGSQGVENTHPANHGGTVQFEGGSVKLVPAWHTSSYGDDFVAPGVPAGLVVRFGGKTIYFAGDTCLFGDMQLIGNEDLDVAVLPIGDNFTMGAADAVKAASMLRAETVIPCHYNTFPPIQQDPHEFKQMLQQGSPAMRCLVLEPDHAAEL
jgi:L-ascorbate metabolism protein UlaG (beta-lactamase superfamily)